MNLVINNIVDYEYSTPIPQLSTLYYETIPYEYLYTIHTVPQLIVNVGGTLAVCDAEVGCDYKYVDPSSYCSSISGD